MTTAYARRLRHRVLREQDYQFWLDWVGRRDTDWARLEYADRRSTRIWDGPTHEVIYRRGKRLVVPLRRPR